MRERGALHFWLRCVKALGLGEEPIFGLLFSHFSWGSTCSCIEEKEKRKERLGLIVSR